MSLFQELHNINIIQGMSRVQVSDFIQVNKLTLNRVYELEGPVKRKQLGVVLPLEGPAALVKEQSPSLVPTAWNSPTSDLVFPDIAAMDDEDLDPNDLNLDVQTAKWEEKMAIREAQEIADCILHLILEQEDFPTLNYEAEWHIHDRHSVLLCPYYYYPFKVLQQCFSQFYLQIQDHVNIPNDPSLLLMVINLKTILLSITFDDENFHPIGSHHVYYHDCIADKECHPSTFQTLYPSCAILAWEVQASVSILNSVLETGQNIKQKGMQDQDILERTMSPGRKMAAKDILTFVLEFNSNNYKLWCDPLDAFTDVAPVIGADVTADQVQAFNDMDMQARGVIKLRIKPSFYHHMKATAKETLEDLANHYGTPEKIRDVFSFPTLHQG
ncbi:hypothetical protein J3A83DRAFT_4186257 [Scleroderma citrinum]